MSTIRWPTTIPTRIRIRIHVLTLTIMLTLCGVDYNSKSLFYTLKICCELIFSYRNKIHEFFSKKWRNQIPCAAISNGFKTTQTETQKFNHSNRETVALPTTSTQWKITMCGWACWRLVIILQLGKCLLEIIVVWKTKKEKIYAHCYRTQIASAFQMILFSSKRVCEREIVVYNNSGNSENANLNTLKPHWQRIIRFIFNASNLIAFYGWASSFPFFSPKPYTQFVYYIISLP